MQPLARLTTPSLAPAISSALIPFSRATLYREMEAGRFPAAHEIAPRRIAWFKDEVASRQLGTKKVA
jgi:prophage regulatory protein